MKTFFCLLIVIPVLSFGAEKINWVDLPPDSLRDILYEYDEKFDKLNELTQNYHSIYKTDWGAIDLRINALYKVANYSDKLKAEVNNKYLLNTARKYSTLSKEKARYLQKLEELKEYKYQKLKNDIFNVSIVPPTYIPLLLNNDRKLEYKTQEFWGQCLIEAIDPCHRRQLLSYHEVWSKNCKECDLLDFFIWLEDQNVSVFLPSINSLSKEELEKYKILIKDGKFYFPDGRLVTTDTDADMSSDIKVSFKQEPIFIIDADEKMFLMYSGESNAHTTLSNYLPLIGSGKIYLEKGLVKKISFESGHYLPRIEHFVQVINFFEDRDVSLNSDMEVIYYIGYKDNTAALHEFREKYMDKSCYIQAS